MELSDPATLLADGCIKLGLTISQKDSDRLLTYLDLITKWNHTHNLTALSARAEMVVKHLLDSLSVAPRLPTGRVLDVGSGAGLPGVPLAVANPDQSFTLLDASFKRVAFLHEVKRRLRLANIEPVHSRVEDYRESPFAVITCRAFSSLTGLLNSSEHLLTSDGCWLAMKGRLPGSEIDQLPEGFRLGGTEVLCVPGLDAERHLVKIVRD